MLLGFAVLWWSCCRFCLSRKEMIAVRAARKELGLATSQTILVGDTMETDILGGVQMGYRTILVLSGSTKETDLARYAYGPDRIIGSVAELADPSVDLMHVVPSGDDSEDSVPDLQEWKRSAW